jgi:hypothetical protein
VNSFNHGPVGDFPQRTVLHKRWPLPSRAGDSSYPVEELTLLHMRHVADAFLVNAFLVRSKDPKARQCLPL